MNKIFYLLILSLIFPFSLFSKIQVITYFPLESHLVKKIAQNEVSIREISGRFLEEYHEIPSSEISRFSDAKVYFHFGLKIEKEYAKLFKNKNRNLLEMDMSKDVEKIGENPYVWMDPFLMRIVAKNIYETLISLDKANGSFYKTNYENFLNEIDDTFLKIKQKISNSDITVIYAFDDYWDYFGKRFRIKIIKREKKSLNISEVPELIKFTQQQNINKVLFSSNQDYNNVLSLSKNLNIKSIEDSIFRDNWQLTLLTLSDNISK